MSSPASGYPGKPPLVKDFECHILTYDKGVMYWGGEIGENHFCVKVLRGEQPLKIKEFKISTSVEPVECVSNFQVDKDDGWCHYNYSFTASKSGLYRIIVQSNDSVERDIVIYISDPHEERKENKDAVSAQEFLNQHLHAGDKQKGLGDLSKFRQWGKSKAWDMFGPYHSHYDWWMFPIADRASYPQYAVSASLLEELKANTEFVRNYLEGVTWMSLAWGWNIEEQSWVAKPDREMGWNNWSVRLGKLGKSLLLFGEMYYFNSMRTFLLCLKERQSQDHSISISKQFGIHPDEVFLRLANGSMSH